MPKINEFKGVMFPSGDMSIRMKEVYRLEEKLKYAIKVNSPDAILMLKELHDLIKTIPPPHQ